MPERLRIAVCIKQVPDPEGPPSAFVIDGDALSVSPRGIPPVVSTFDESALEIALRLKDEHGAEISLISAGKDISMAVMLKALATGADEIIFVEGEELASDGLGSLSTAFVLVAAIRKTAAFDLILTGQQAADTNAGQVGVAIAEYLSIPCVTLARDIKLNDTAVRIKRVIPDGYETVSVPLPLLATVSRDAGDLRYPRMADIKAAKGKPVTRWSAGDLGIEPRGGEHVKLRRIYKPVLEKECFIVTGETPHEAAENLALKLRQDNVI